MVLWCFLVVCGTAVAVCDTNTNTNNNPIVVMPRILAPRTPSTSHKLYHTLQDNTSSFVLPVVPLPHLPPLPISFLLISSRLGTAVREDDDGDDDEGPSLVNQLLNADKRDDVINAVFNRKASKQGIIAREGITRNRFKGGFPSRKRSANHHTSLRPFIPL